MNIDEHGTPPAESEVITLFERLHKCEQKAHDEARTKHGQVDVQPHAALASPLQTSLSTESPSLWTIPKLSFQPKLWRLCSLRGKSFHNIVKEVPQQENNFFEFSRIEIRRVSDLIYKPAKDTLDHLCKPLTFHWSVWRVIVPIIVLQNLTKLCLLEL